ncbi:MAG: NAD+ synthase [Phycisphaerales bacterium]|nr:NAD+ synthase [Phycisphaerales bacterium]
MAGRTTLLVVRLALLQFNPTVGDLAGNARRTAELAARAAEAGADLAVFPELSLAGYPPYDLLLQEGFCEAARAAAADLAGRTPAGLAVVVGLPWKEPGERPTNSLALLLGGRAERLYDKQLLPTYDVFDEDRYFRPGVFDGASVRAFGGVRVGFTICEDIWRGEDAISERRYADRPDPVAAIMAQRPGLIVNASASPFVLGKGARQRRILTRLVEAHAVAAAAVNQVGGNDDLIFGGHSAVYAPARGGPARLVAAAPGFREHVLLCDLPADRAPAVPDPLLGQADEAMLWEALVLGVRDYCRKTGFRKVLLGLSGGIDSALTACVAAAAVGPANVLGVGMPARFSSSGSVSDARDLAQRLGIGWLVAPIEDAHALFERQMAGWFAAVGAPGEPGITEENVQSRLRGLTLMALSNKTGALVLTTGNKSELAVGYCTLYGDMNGGLAVLSDVTKMRVYALSRWLNANAAAAGFAAAPIPESSITKPPSAELRPNQTDQDTLPPYEVLDAIIAQYVDERRAPEAIARATGADPALVRRVCRMTDLAEYKRQQMAIGLKVTGSAFGRGRRWPVAQGYRP